MDWPKFKKLFSAVGMLVLLTTAIGCGDGRGLVDVRGTVTLEGEPMPFAGTVRFLPKSTPTGIPRRAATGRFDTDGTYEAYSFKPGDGVYPGTYAVTVECWEVMPSMSGPAAVNAIDPKYQNPGTSEFEFVVESGESEMTFDIDLKAAAEN